MKNLYEVLEVDSKASTEEIKRKYKRLAKQHHPDKGGDTSMFQNILYAYNTLSDPSKRREYDLNHIYTLDGLFNSLFSNFNINNWKKTVKEFNIGIHVSLEELYFGCLKTIHYKENIFCEYCDGCGFLNKKCENCEKIQGKCIHCLGTGKIVSNVKCKNCQRGFNEQKSQKKINILPGAKHGDLLTYPSSINKYKNGESNDLIIHIVQKRHSHLTRLENDLQTRIQISLKESLIGFEKQLPWLTNKKVKVRSENIIKDGEKIILPGYGMPIVPSIFGNLLVEIKVVYPKQRTLSKQDKQKIGEIFCRKINE